MGLSVTLTIMEYTQQCGLWIQDIVEFKKPKRVTLEFDFSITSVAKHMHSSKEVNGNRPNLITYG